MALALKAKVPSVTAVTTVTETLDTNELLCGPGQYASAAWIADSGALPGRHALTAAPSSKCSPPLLTPRRVHIQGVLKKIGPIAGTEWHHLQGSTLLRVNGKLSPSVNDQYTAAFGR